MADPKPTERLSLASTLAILRRRWYIVALCLIAVPVMTYVVSSGKPKRYETSAKILFRDSGRDKDIFSSAPGVPSGVDNPDVASATNRDLLELPAVADRVAKAVGGTVTPGAVAARIDAAAT